VSVGTPQAILVGGWFDSDGVSQSTVEPFQDGWFFFVPDTDLDERLTYLEATLRAYKPIFINTDGNLQELVI